MCPLSQEILVPLLISRAARLGRMISITLFADAGSLPCRPDPRVCPSVQMWFLVHRFSKRKLSLASPNIDDFCISQSWYEHTISVLPAFADLIIKHADKLSIQQGNCPDTTCPKIPSPWDSRDNVALAVGQCCRTRTGFFVYVPVISVSLQTTTNYLRNFSASDI